jgi:hypothetical protein
MSYNELHQKLTEALTEEENLISDTIREAISLLNLDSKNLTEHQRQIIGKCVAKYVNDWPASQGPGAHATRTSNSAAGYGHTRGSRTCSWTTRGSANELADLITIGLQQ